MELGTPAQREHIVIGAVLPHFDELVRDKIGSNLAQTAFRVATLAHQDEIVAKMVRDVVELSCDPFANYLLGDVMRSHTHGTAVQKEALVTATLQNADRLSQHRDGQFRVRDAFSMMNYWNPQRHKNVIEDLILGRWTRTARTPGD